MNQPLDVAKDEAAKARMKTAVVKISLEPAHRGRVSIDGIPGLLYSLWRLSSRERVCSACGHASLIPVSSPRGRALVLEFSALSQQLGNRK
jgi:hypothetical protein